MTARRRPMVRLGDLIPDAARALGLEDELRLSRAIATFEALVAERVPAAAGACRVVRLDGFALIVEADRADRRPGASGCAGRELLVGVRRWHPAAGRRAASCASTSGPGVAAYDPPPAVSSPRRLGMAVRLQLKLGVVAEHDRLADSPDTLVVVEPSVGSVARSKGHLYLLVTSRVATRHALGGDPPGGRDHPQRVLLRRVGRDPRVPPEGHRDGQQAAHPPGRPARAQVGRRRRPDRRRRRGRPRPTRCTWRRSDRPRPT